MDCETIQKERDRYCKALEIILNMKCFGTSFAWSEMKNVASYALTGKEQNNTWPMKEQDKTIIKGDF